ncbi:MAG: non-hydrolyzing UDP-N-acetylglucosamine 2-epimerase [Candidatus Nitrospinota bacterium M3_3B_026]
MKLAHVVGARPQFMQAAPLRRELEARGHREILIHTGQHYDYEMSRVFFEELGIPAPDVNLEVGSAGHGAMTGRIIEAVERALLETRPDVVIVDGDTNSTLGGALAAAKLPLPLVHVESGLRSGDRRMPEEVNRIVTDHVSGLLLAPTATAIENLEREGLSDRATLTGDLMCDCYISFREKARRAVVGELGLGEGAYALITLHRAENTNDPERFTGFMKGLAALPLPSIFPVHPRARAMVDLYRRKGGPMGQIRLTGPRSYLEMIALEEAAEVVFTDSGGVQREAYHAGAPSVVLRDNTEWREQVEAGWTYLAMPSEESILSAYEKSRRRPEERPDIYGGGEAAKRMVDAIEARFG